MHQTYTPPSTIPGISRLAKSLRQQNGIKHTQALEEAAKVAGFQSYKHAKRALAASGDTDTLASLYLTVFWYDRDATPFSGRCTALVKLPKLTVDLLGSLSTRGHTMLGGFQLESPDHLRAVRDASSHESAKSRVINAVRELQFSSATGLRPMRKASQVRRYGFLHSLPGNDHLSLWVDPATGDGLALDEPYEPRLTSNKLAERVQWLASNGLAEIAPNWVGLYAPGRAVPYLVSQNAGLLQRIAAVVEGLSEPPSSIDWASHSGPYQTEFVSPQRLASGKRYRPRPQRSFGERAGALPYGGGPGFASEWRPAETLSVRDHMKLGAILRGLAWSRVSGRTHSKLISTLSRLDDWSFCEHPNESSDTLSDLYYGSDRRDCSSTEKQLEALARARQLVVTGYNECRPRQELLAVFDKVELDVMARVETEQGAPVTAHTRQ